MFACVYFLSKSYFVECTKLASPSFLDGSVQDG